MTALAGAIVGLSSGGKRFRLKGVWTYNLGGMDRKVIMGHDGPVGYSENPRPPGCEGEITDHPSFDVVQELYNFKDKPLILELRNGKTILFEGAWFEGDGTISTDEANIKARFGCMRAKEIK